MNCTYNAYNAHNARTSIRLKKIKISKMKIYEDYSGLQKIGNLHRLAINKLFRQQEPRHYFGVYQNRLWIMQPTNGFYGGIPIFYYFPYLYDEIIYHTIYTYREYAGFDLFNIVPNPYSPDASWYATKYIGLAFRISSDHICFKI